MAPKRKPVDVDVADDDELEPLEPMSVVEAAAEGTQLDLMRAMRTRVAAAVDDPDTPARDLAALTRRLMEIAKQIEVLEAAEDQEAGRSGHVEDEAFDASAI